MNARARLGGLITAMVGTAALGLVAPGGALADAPTIADDQAAHAVTITGDDYALRFDYDHKAVITSLRHGDHEFMGSSPGGGGVFSAVNLQDGSWVTSTALAASPTVTLDGNTVTAAFSTPVAHEVWTFTAYPDRVTFRLARRYDADQTVARQGTPIIDLAQHAAENIRWPGDGGNWPVEPASVTNGLFPGYWIGPTSPSRASTRVSKEQLGFTLLNSTHDDALRVIGRSSASDVLRGESSVAERLPDQYGGMLRFYMFVAADGLDYRLSPTMPDGSLPTYEYFSQATTAPDPFGYWGHHTTRSENLFDPVAVHAGETVWTELTFAPDDLEPYYDLGTLNGLASPENLSRMVNDYGRFAISDKAQAGFFEGPNWRSDLVPNEFHWLTQMIDTFQQDKAAAVDAMEGGLANQRDELQDPDGHLYPGPTTVTKAVDWGRNLPDSQSGYVLGIADTYAMSGDRTWLAGFKASAEKALDYELTAYVDPETKLVRLDRAAHNPELHSNAYWEIAWWNGQNSADAIGHPNGYTSAMLYDALRRWVELETDVLGDPAMGQRYAQIADQLQASFNADKAAGGAWLPSIDSVMLSTTTAEVPYLPAIGAALKSDLLNLERRQAMSAGYLDDLTSNGVDFMVNNVHDLGDATRLSDYTHLGTDGGMYGAAAGDGYATFVYADARDAAKHFTDAWLSKPMTSWYGSSYFSREGTPLEYDNDFPSTANMAWGLYHYIYGFQPRADRLDIAPFIWDEMIGSTVDYTYRGANLRVEYLGLDTFRVEVSEMPAHSSIRVKWVNHRPNTPGYVVSVNGRMQVERSDAEGTVNYDLTQPGTYTLKLVNVPRG